ncbi:hypothetical protein DI53_2425 [Sphingobacterium deserti]|uniref:Uncharacterized protein n=1 Tax=Sphingobacterium deserti TaxID=1229276 RepID=A0A0B8T6Q4_9SPHI|nr:hypothetical protein DI53_2425 [Sphingobacterium deserti]
MAILKFLIIIYLNLPLANKTAIQKASESHMFFIAGSAMRNLHFLLRDLYRPNRSQAKNIYNRCLY